VVTSVVVRILLESNGKFYFLDLSHAVRSYVEDPFFISAVFPVSACLFGGSESSLPLS
jgi:hypothetical protein